MHSAFSIFIFFLYIETKWVINAWVDARMFCLSHLSEITQSKKSTMSTESQTPTAQPLQCSDYNDLRNWKPCLKSLNNKPLPPEESEALDKYFEPESRFLTASEFASVPVQKSLNVIFAKNEINNVSYHRVRARTESRWADLQFKFIGYSKKGIHKFEDKKKTEPSKRSKPTYQILLDIVKSDKVAKVFWERRHKDTKNDPMYRENLKLLTTTVDSALVRLGFTNQQIWSRKEQDVDFFMQTIVGDSMNRKESRLLKWTIYPKDAEYSMFPYIALTFQAPKTPQEIEELKLKMSKTEKYKELKDFSTKFYVAGKDWDGRHTDGLQQIDADLETIETKYKSAEIPIVFFVKWGQNPYFQTRLSLKMDVLKVVLCPDEPLENSTRHQDSEPEPAPVHALAAASNSAAGNGSSAGSVAGVGSASNTTVPVDPSVSASAGVHLDVEGRGVEPAHASATLASVDIAEAIPALEPAEKRRRIDSNC